MSNPYTYESLVSSVIDILEDDGVEFRLAIDGALYRVTDRLSKMINTEQVVTVASVLMTSGAAVNLFPGISASNVVVRSMGIETSLGYVALRERPLDYVREYWPRSATTGVPKYFYYPYSDAFYVAPTPDQNYECIVRYELARIPPLSTSVASNILSEHHGLAYLYATVAEMLRWQQNFQAATEYDKLTLAQIELDNNERMRQHRVDNEEVKEVRTNEIR